MKLSFGQVRMFWSLWSGACSAQGWMNAEREQRRREVLGSLGFQSLTDVDQGDGFDRVRAELLRLSDRLDGATESAFPEIGRMRRDLWIVEHRLIPALVKSGRDPERYIASIIEDRGWGVHWMNIPNDPQRGPARARELMLTLTRATRALSRGSKSPRRPTPKPQPQPVNP